MSSEKFVNENNWRYCLDSFNISKKAKNILIKKIKRIHGVEFLKKKPFIMKIIKIIKFKEELITFRKITEKKNAKFRFQIKSIELKTTKYEISF